MEFQPFTKRVLRRFEVLEKSYEEEGSMTLRRCFYILVGKGLIKNSKVSYNLLSKHLVRARESGIVDWDLLVDRHRTILQRTTYSTFDEIFEVACESYRKDSMKLQKNYVEVWIEKDAVSGIVYNYTHDLDVPLFVGKGFSSITHIKKASERFKSQDKPCEILYISDFDPEGEYFPKKVEDKLEQYGCDNVKVHKISLTKSQVRKYSLPSNVDFSIHEKHKEKKYVQDFIKENGEVQIELDALSNKILLGVLKKKVEELIDLKLIEKSNQESIKEVEEWKKENLKS